MIIIGKDRSPPLKYERAYSASTSLSSSTGNITPYRARRDSKYRTERTQSKEKRPDKKRESERAPETSTRKKHKVH